MILTVFIVIAPVFVIIFVGYMAVRFRVFPKEGVGYVMKFAHNFAVPMLLFNAISHIDFRAYFRLDILAAYFVPMLIVFFMGFWIGRIFGRSAVSSTVLGFNAFFANSVLLGLAISERAYGVESLATNYVIMAVHSPLAYMLGAFAMEFSKPRPPRLRETFFNALSELAKNPLIIGIMAGLLVNFLRIPLPRFILDASEMLARAAIPVALFALGGTLTSFKVRGWIAPILSISVVRLFVHAGLVLLVGGLILRLENDVLRSVALIATMPTGTNGYIFASLYKAEEETAASIVFLTTLISMLTIPMWLLLLAQI